MQSPSFKNGVAGTGNTVRWRDVFRGEERELAVVRRWLTSLLPECPARDDVIAVATDSLN
jgi:hypothetical protein